MKRKLGRNYGAIIDHITAIRRYPRHAKAYSNQAIIKWELDELKAAFTDGRLAFDFADQDSVQQVRNECKLGCLKSVSRQCHLVL